MYARSPNVNFPSWSLSSQEDRVLGFRRADIFFWLDWAVFSDEQMSNKVGVEHQQVEDMSNRPRTSEVVATQHLSETM